MNLRQAIKVAQKVLTQNQPVQLPALIVDGEYLRGDPTSPLALVVNFGEKFEEPEKYKSVKFDATPLTLDIDE